MTAERRLDSLDLENIEAAALGKTGVGAFAHPSDTLLLLKLLAAKDEEITRLTARIEHLKDRIDCLRERQG